MSNVVKVTRCKDCEFWNKVNGKGVCGIFSECPSQDNNEPLFTSFTYEDDFCSNAVKKG